MAQFVTIVDFIPDAKDGWDWAVSDVRALARGEKSMVQALAPVLELGSITARMHICLSESQAHTATAEDVQTWVRWFEQDLEASGISGDLVDEVRRALPTIEMAIGTPISAIHGDYHVGQILRSASTPGAAARYVVVDFDGSPLLTPAERTLRQPPARDVASMLASLDHVGRVVLHRTEDLTEHQRSTVLQWIDRSQSVLLAAYLAELDQAGKLEFANARLTAAFQVQQELREHAYARRYLPHWHYVPDAALPALIARQRGDSRES
jgi:maltokinase